MILNFFLMFLVIGWTINGGAFAARNDLKWCLINSALACAAGFWLVARLG